MELVIDSFYDADEIMSYYLKYRPQRVDELDLVRVRESLEKILRSGEFSHAYLFSGPKGTGKTSSARILAKVLNCIENGDEKRGKRKSLKEPCGKCDHCRSVKNGTSLSVIEMDAASNRGIDDVRQLRERIGLAPAGGQFSVYVIDEVHMLTTEAFNALLKTLEEPPKHAVFVLCTTEPHKLPATVISRCTQITFTKATPDEIEHSLAKAIKGEKLKIEPSATEALSQRADGSFRDAMKVLEQLAQDHKKITVEAVDEVTGFGVAYDPDGLIEMMLKRDVKGALSELDEKDKAGVDFVVFGGRLMGEMRDRLLEEVKSKKPDNIGDLTDLTKVLSSAVLQIKAAMVPQLPLEVAVVEWCMDHSDKNQREEVRSKKQDDSGNTDMLINKRGEKLGKKDEPKNNTKKKTGKVSFEEVEGRWNEVLRAVRPLNHSLEALLRACRPKEIDGDWLTLQVYYTFHKEQLEQDRHRRMLEGEMAKLFDADVKLRYELGKRATKVSKGVQNITGSVEDEELARAAEEIFAK